MPSAAASSEISMMAPSNGWSGFAATRSRPFPPRLPTRFRAAGTDRRGRGRARDRTRRAARVAHGLFPALLAEEGLAAALEALTEEAPVEIEIGALPQSLPSTAEAAAYFVVSEAIKRSRDTPDKLAARGEGDQLVVELEADIAASEIVALEDRVGGGRRNARGRAPG